MRTPRVTTDTCRAAFHAAMERATSLTEPASQIEVSYTRHGNRFLF